MTLSRTYGKRKKLRGGRKKSRRRKRRKTMRGGGCACAESMTGGRRRRRRKRKTKRRKNRRRRRSRKMRGGGALQGSCVSWNCNVPSNIGEMFTGYKYNTNPYLPDPKSLNSNIKIKPKMKVQKRRRTSSLNGRFWIRRFIIRILERLKHCCKYKI